MKSQAYWAEKIKIVTDKIEEDISVTHRIASLAKLAKMNETQLKIRFRASLGTPIYAYLHQKRLSEAKRLLIETDLSFADIAHKVGYAFQSNFNASFKKYVGQTPSEYRISNGYS